MTRLGKDQHNGGEIADQRGGVSVSFWLIFSGLNSIHQKPDFWEKSGFSFMMRAAPTADWQ
jgi:hypothetical protein